MKTGLIIGNGESRKNFDINSIPSSWIKFGCNAIYRDYYVDNLIASDNSIIKEIQNADKSKYGNLYTKKRLNDFYNEDFCSGLLAADLALKNTFEVLYLVGFEQKGLGNTNKKINNIYKDTPRYPFRHTHDKISGTWITKFPILFKFYYPNSFIFVHDNDTKPPAWKNWDNSNYITYEKFNKVIQRKKIQECQ